MKVLRHGEDKQGIDGFGFELSVERSRALDAFYHPFAYAARRSPELLDVAA